MSLQISTLSCLQLDLLAVRDLNLLFNLSERLSRTLISFEIVGENRPNSDENTNIAFQLKVLVQQSLFVRWVELFFTQQHLLFASLQVFDLFGFLCLQVFSLLDPLLQLSNFELKLTFFLLSLLQKCLLCVLLGQDPIKKLPSLV
jgi:hypothetical protein